MMNLCNGQERTLDDFARLLDGSGWKLKRVFHIGLHLPSQLVLVPDGCAAPVTLERTALADPLLRQEYHLSGRMLWEHVSARCAFGAAKLPDPAGLSSPAFAYLTSLMLNHHVMTRT
jgi:hypothetical protein